MEYLFNSDYAFPGANREYACGGGGSGEPNSSKRCCYQKLQQQKESRGKGLMTKDAGTSNDSSMDESLVFEPKKSDLKLGLNFSRSRIETACETDLSQNGSSSEKIEVVDLTKEKVKAGLPQLIEEPSIDSDGLHQTNDATTKEGLITRSYSFSSDIQTEKRKKSLLLQNLENNQKKAQKANKFNLHSTISEEGSDNQVNSDGDNVYLGKRVFRNPVELAELNGGKMLKMKKTKEGMKVSFTCQMNHRFSLFAHHKDRWCKVCDALLLNAKQHAEKNKGRLLSQKLTSELVFECEQKHQWKVSYKKCLRSWCKVCKKKRKQMVKEILAEEKKRIEAGLKNKQNKLLEEARITMVRENSKRQENKENHKNTFKMLEKEISRIAKRYAKEFVAQSEESNTTQMVELYKVLILPDKAFQQYFDALTKIELKKEFRRYTILLHPDKNCHPKAKSAFQKIYERFETAMKKREKKLDNDR